MWRLHPGAMPPPSLSVTPSLPVAVTDSPVHPCRPLSHAPTLPDGRARPHVFTPPSFTAGGRRKAG